MKVASSSSSSSFILKTSISSMLDEGLFFYMKSLHTSLNTTHSRTKHFHVIIHTFFPSLHIPSLISCPCHLHLSTGRCLIIYTPMLQIPKPPKSAMPHHFCHTLYTQKTVQIHTAFPILVIFFPRLTKIIRYINKNFLYFMI